MISFTERTIVNGALLRNFQNQHITIHVNVQPEVERQSTVIKAKTTDDMEVTINLSEPLNAPVKGWIEVIGVPTGSNVIRNKEVCLLLANCCEIRRLTMKSLLDFFFPLQIIIFPEEGTEPYDKNAYNQMVTFWNNCPDIYKLE